jgi:hypothetical protein
MPATLTESQLINQALFEQLSTPGMEKQAIDAVNDFTRIKMREDGFYRRIMPPLTITNEDLDRQVDTDKPVKVIDKEPDNPPAQSIPFATLPSNQYIRGGRYRVMFDRIVTPRFTKDVDELRTWIMDIRQVLSDNAIKDMLAEEDGKFIAAVNLALIAADTIVPASGVAQWQTVNGGITRDGLQDAFKIMPKTPFHLETHTVLINNVTIREVFKWGRDEMGGDFSQDVVKNGWSETEFMNCKWIVTIKRDLVPDDTIYMFADPKFIGKSFMLEDTTMYIKREAYLLEFFAYETAGGTIGHTGGLARADFV